MKNATFKTVLTCCAALALCQAAEAQRVTFEQNRDFRDQVGWPVHRGCPIVADFDNDGFMDVYYGGTSCENGWACRGVLARSNGDGAFSANLEAIFDYETTYEKVYSLDTIWHEDGSYELQDSILDGKVVMDTIVTEKFVGMKNGLPVSLRGFGSQPFDFNSDGLVDFITLNQGGNMSGLNPRYTLVKNLGGGQFETVEDAALAAFNYTGDDNFLFNEGSQYASLVTGDYDRDGYTDLLITGQAPTEGRFVKLFRNVNGERFENVNVFHPLPFDKEPNRKGLYKLGESIYDPETGTTVEGEYTEEPTMQAKPLSHGSVAFIDFDNDGWLDIVSTGWADGTEGKLVGVEIGGDEIRFYRNLQNGEFQDVTDRFVGAAQGILDMLDIARDANYEVRDVFSAWGMDSGLMLATDFDQDGKMDLWIHGAVAGGRPRFSSYLTFGMGEDYASVEEWPTGILPAHTVAKLGVMFADFNGDDIPDFYQRGCCDEICQDESVPEKFGQAYSWSRLFSISEGQVGAYGYPQYADYWTAECYGARIPQSDGDGQTMDATFGDVNGDGLLDIMSTDWTDKADDAIPSYNVTEGAEVIMPDEPEIIEAETGKGCITLKWDRSEMNNGNAAMYNVYARSKDGSMFRILVPANIETGKQLSYQMFGTYATTYAEDYQYYTFDKLPAGDYTVGVQAVNYAYAATPFVTTDVTVTEGADGVKLTSTTSAALKVVVDGDVLTVVTDEDVQVNIYNMQGSEVGSGRTNEAITVNGKGVFVVEAGDKVAKIVK